MDHPIRNWHEHSREVFSIDWNNLKKDMFLSSSWDASVKVVSANGIQTGLSGSVHSRALRL